MPPMPVSEREDRLANLAPLVMNELVAEGKRLVESGTLANIYDGFILREGSFVLVLDVRGNLVGIKDIRTERTITVKAKEKTIHVAVPMEVPYCRKHSNASDDAHLGADNAQYLLGIREGKDVLAQFHASAELHTRVFQKVNSPLAKAICQYFARWDPAHAWENEALAGLSDEQRKAFVQSNYLIFGLDNGPTELEDVEIRAAFKDYFWDDIYNAPGTKYGTSYISGEKNVPLADLFGSISGVSGAQSSGASPTSWGRRSDVSSVNFMALRRGENYQTSKIEAILYIEALTYLLNDKRHHRLMPDGRYKVFWTDALDGQRIADTALGMAAFDIPAYVYDTPEDELVAHAVSSMLNASPTADDYAELVKRSGVRYYSLNAKGNSARLQLTNFECGTLGGALESVCKHSMDTALVSARSEDAGALKTFAFSTLLRGLEPKKNIQPDGTCKSSLHPNLYNEILESVLRGRKYPEYVGRRIVTLVSFDHYLSQERIALMRGYILRNGTIQTAREAASTPFLNTETNFQPYILGQVFSTMLTIQNAASTFPGTTIEDRYIGQMLSQPTIALPGLLSLTMRHLHKLKRDPQKRPLGFVYERKLTTLMDRIAYPMDDSLQMLPECQMAFCLGFKMAQWFHFMPKKVKEELASQVKPAEQTPGLREEENEPAYLAGRLLCLCEAIQARALPEVQYTVRDKYFPQAISRPEGIVHYAMETAPNYVNKLLRNSATRGIGMWYKQQLEELTTRTLHADGNTDTRPPRKEKVGMGVVLGYFHEYAKRFKTGQNGNVDSDETEGGI